MKRTLPETNWERMTRSAKKTKKKHTNFVCNHFTKMISTTEINSVHVSSVLFFIFNKSSSIFWSLFFFCFVKWISFKILNALFDRKKCISHSIAPVFSTWQKKNVKMKIMFLIRLERETIKSSHFNRWMIERTIEQPRKKTKKLLSDNWTGKTEY